MLGTDDYRTQKVHVSPSGGKFRIVPEGILYSIKSESGGILPSVARTQYTSLKAAEQALQRYFKTKEKPSKED